MSSQSASSPSSAATVKLLLPRGDARLWVGGWAALNDDCSALRQKVTHVVSVLSADKRQLPAFVEGHLYVRVDDTPEAADTLARPSVSPLSRRRASGRRRLCALRRGDAAPTSVCSYLIWKLGIRERCDQARAQGAPAGAAKCRPRRRSRQEGKVRDGQAQVGSTAEAPDRRANARSTSGD